MNWNQWLNWANLKLKKSLFVQRDAEILLGKIVNQSRTQLLAFGETVLTYHQVMQLNSLIERRKLGEPFAYLIGSQEFWSLDFQLSPGVFIPRPDTECLVECILKLFSKPDLKVLDLGTGIGTIALSIASERPNWNITGIDQQKQALALAYKNKLLFKIKNVEFYSGNWFRYLAGQKFNLIVSNPPYISKYDACWLTHDMHFEPKSALLSKKFGLQDLQIICQNAINHLYTNGWLFLEHGWDQGSSVRSLFKKSGFNYIQTVRDYNNHERVTYGQQ